MLSLTQRELGQLKLGRNSRSDKPPAVTCTPPDPSLITSTVSYNHRKMLIASFGVDEWTVDWSDADGAMVYEARE